MNRPHERLRQALALLLCAAPLFVVTVRGWSSGVLFFGCALSVLVLVLLPPVALAPPDRAASRWLLLALCAPLAAGFASALLRGDAELRQFDAPVRFVLAMPVALAVARSGIDPARLLQWSLPAMLALTLGHHLVVGQPAHWGEHRMTAGFADPLVFGYLSLSFGMMCLLSITPEDLRARRWPGLLVRLLGLGLGLYLSIRSGSRSGWLAVPLLLALWLQMHWGRAHRWAWVAALAAAAGMAVAAYLVLPMVQERVDLALQDVFQRPWDSPDNSVGLRLTYLRIAADVFLQHPWMGVGDTSRNAPAALTAFSYAAPSAVNSAFTSAFHNQIVSNAVRSGLGGLVATALLLLVPLAVCARALGAASSVTRRNACMGVAFFTCLFVSSLSTEVVDLKYAASFYALMAGLLCGACLAPGARTT